MENAKAADVSPVAINHFMIAASRDAILVVTLPISACKSAFVAR